MHALCLVSARDDDRICRKTLITSVFDSCFLVMPGAEFSTAGSIGAIVWFVYSGPTAGLSGCYVDQNPTHQIRTR